MMSAEDVVAYLEEFWNYLWTILWAILRKVTPVALAIYLVFLLIRIAGLSIATGVFFKTRDLVGEYTGLDNIWIATSVAAVLAVLFWFLLGPVFSFVFKPPLVSRKRYTLLVPIVALVLAVSISATMYQLTESSAPDAFFRAYDGKPVQWYVREPNGQIVFFKYPGYDTHYSLQRLPVTLEIVQEYEGLGRGRWLKISVSPPWVRASESEQIRPWERDKQLDMWIEGVGIVHSRTVVFVGFKSWTNVNEAVLDPASRTNLVDSDGLQYPLKDGTLANQPGLTGATDSALLQRQVLKSGEIRKFTFAFPRLREGTPAVTFNHPQFPPVTVQLQWDN